MSDPARGEKGFTLTEKLGNPPILLRLPSEVGIPLLKEAKKRKCTIQSLILEIVAVHYKVESPAPARGRPKNVTE